MANIKSLLAMGLAKTVEQKQRALSHDQRELVKGRRHIKDIIKNRIRGTMLPSSRLQTPRDFDENTMTNVETAEES